jgi:hypothetical protein
MKKAALGTYFRISNPQAGSSIPSKARHARKGCTEVSVSPVFKIDVNQVECVAGSGGRGAEIIMKTTFLL